MSVSYFSRRERNNNDRIVWVPDGDIGRHHIRRTYRNLRQVGIGPDHARDIIVGLLSCGKWATRRQSLA